MKRLSIVIVLLCLLASLTIVATRTFGTTNDPADPDSLTATLYRDLQLIDSVWCWQGLCPGKTTLAQADAMYAANTAGRYQQGFNPNEWIWQPSNAIWRVNLVYSSDDILTIIRVDTDRSQHPYLPQVTLVDMVLQFGTPAYVSRALDSQPSTSKITMCSVQALCMITSVVGEPRLQMQTPLQNIFLRVPQVIVDQKIAEYYPPWRGFALYYRSANG
jgi:hypothetical protein